MIIHPKNTFSKLNLQTLYESGLSLSDIASKLDCSIHKIVYWMDKYDIPKRSISDALYRKLNPHGDPFHIKVVKTFEEEVLYGLGLGIYWGEGNKSSPHSLRVSNTDSNMIKVFIRFLKVICDVKKEKMRFSIVCFNDSNIEEVKTYWSDHIKILPEQFGKIVQVKPQGRGTYKNKSRYGVCTLTVSNIKLKQWIMSELKSTSEAWIV